MSADPFVPADFEPPATLATDRFRLEPLGPEHNEADLEAWTSSIQHIRSTAGFPNGDWPPERGMSAAENHRDLLAHARDFKARTGFTFTVLDEAGVVIGCVYIYPTVEPGYEAGVRSWVSADHAELDAPLAEAVAQWLAADWPWTKVCRHGRQ